MWIVAAGGLVVLVGLATLIGLALDNHSRKAAWVRIADSRRVNVEHRRALEERAVALDLRESALDRRERRATSRTDLLEHSA